MRAYLLSLLLLWFSPVGVTTEQTEVLKSDLVSPWGLALTPQGGVLITERRGTLWHRTPSGQWQAISGIPPVFERGQGGLLDILVPRGFRQSGWLYLSYAEGSANSNRLTLARARLQQDRLTSWQVLFRASEKDTPVHYGGRILQLPDDSLLLTSGDGFDYREDAQRLDSTLGKIIRLLPDGSIPPDNPLLGSKEAHRAIYSVGHRNPQGLALDPVSGTIWSNEHGPAGGDEINLIRPGLNYGWPVITYGKDYSGARISPFTSYPGMQQPVVDWSPSIAPSSLLCYTGEMFSALKGQLLSTTLKSREVRAVAIMADGEVRQQSHLGHLNERFRDIAMAPDGALLLLTDSGKLIRWFQARD